MTTSGEYEFPHTAAEIVRDALYLLEALEEGEPITAEHTQTGIRALNRLILAWQGDGGHRWAKRDATLHMTGKQCYRFPRDLTGDLAIIGTQRGFGTLSLPSPQPGLITSALITSAVTPEVGDTLQFLNLSGELHTDLVVSVSDTLIGLETGIAGGTALDVQPVWFGPKIESFVTRPMRLMPGQIRRSGTGVNEVPVNLVSRADYFSQVNKDTTGQPTMVFYEAQRDYGELYVWPVGQEGTSLHFGYEAPVEVVTDSAQTVDYPPEWLDALIYNLALRLAPQYAVQPIKYQMIQGMAAQLQADMQAWDQDSGPMFLQPDTQWT